MNTPKTTEQPGKPGIDCYTLAHAETAKKPFGPRITARVVKQLAFLCARYQLSESEACRQLGLNPQTWFNFKSKHSRSADKWTEHVEEFRSQRITNLIERIEKSAEGVDLKQPDFRAALALLTIIDRKRYGQSTQDSPPAASQSPALVLIGGEAGLNKLISLYAAEALAQVAIDAPQAAPTLTNSPTRALIDVETTPEPGK